MIYKPTEQCSICKGKCCKKLPGVCLPEDITKLFPFPTNLLLDSVDAALKSKKFCIDWYEDDFPSYYMRPAIKGNEGIYRDPSWGGECTFLTNEGCGLEFEKRPFGCRSLQPRGKINGVCKSSIKENEKLYAGKLWEKSSVNLGRV